MRNTTTRMLKKLKNITNRELQLLVLNTVLVYVNEGDKASFLEAPIVDVLSFTDAIRASYLHDSVDAVNTLMDLEDRIEIADSENLLCLTQIPWAYDYETMIELVFIINEAIYELEQANPDIVIQIKPEFRKEKVERKFIREDYYQ